MSSWLLSGLRLDTLRQQVQGSRLLLARWPLRLGLAADTDLVGRLRHVFGALHDLQETLVEVPERRLERNFDLRALKA